MSPLYFAHFRIEISLLEELKLFGEMFLLMLLNLIVRMMMRLSMTLKVDQILHWVIIKML